MWPIRPLRLDLVGLEVALARFDGEGTAVQKYAAAKARAEHGAAWIQEVGFVNVTTMAGFFSAAPSRATIWTSMRATVSRKKGAGEGAIAGGLVGALLGPAGIALGLIVGGAIGAHTGAPTDTEAEPEELC